jgi:uncharacterized membrane protein
VPVVIATLYEWLLFVHVIAAMIWVGGVLVLGAFAAMVLRGGDASMIGRFVGILRLVGPIVLAPAPATVLAFGVWMVLKSETWSFDQLWVSLAFGLLIVAFAFGAAFQSRAAIAAARASSRGDGDEAAQHLRRWARGCGLILLVLLVVTWDMVFKPGV